MWIETGILASFFARFSSAVNSGSFGVGVVFSPLAAAFFDLVDFGFVADCSFLVDCFGVGVPFAFGVDVTGLNLGFLTELPGV
jgi:hypothetical protein